MTTAQKQTNNEYLFNVSYEPTPKSNPQEWGVVISASSQDAARADMRKRYPREKGYSFSQMSRNGTHYANPIRLTAQEAAKTN